jgi:DNA replication protein DnaC
VTGTLDRIRANLVGLRMPRALEALDHTIRRMEHGEISALEAIDGLLAEEYAIRESRRIAVALKTARLTPPKTLESFDFSFQPSLDRNRILALAQLDFVARAEVVHFLGPPGTGKSHLAGALGVAAIKAGKSVYRCTLAELVEALGRAEREGRLIEKTRFLSRNRLLIVDEIGYLPISPGGANLFFQLVNARYERSAMILTSNRGFAEWARSSAIRWSPPRCSIVSSTMPSSSRSKGRATACASTPTSSRNTRAPTPPSHRHCRRNAADGHPEPEAPITDPG